MFTGLVEEAGEAAGLFEKSGSAVLKVRAPIAASDAMVGDSIAVNGACLTVTSISGAELSFDLSAETLQSTTLSGLATGQRVNIERAMRAGARLGGHLVTGHVDARGTIRAIRKNPATVEIEVAAPPEVTKYLVPKGSVAIDGISLTVVSLLKDGFTVVIIPHTLSVTTLGEARQGNPVNLEADILGKYVVQYMEKTSGAAQAKESDSKLLDTLNRSGYL